MTSIGSSLPPVNSTAANAAANAAKSSAASSVSSATNALGNEGTFLQLLVAQLKNQDPSQPQDGTQFVSQLATFSNLEQSIGMKTDLDSINSKYTAAAGGAAKGAGKTGA